MRKGFSQFFIFLLIGGFFGISGIFAEPLVPSSYCSFEDQAKIYGTWIDEEGLIHSHYYEDNSYPLDGFSLFSGEFEEMICGGFNPGCSISSVTCLYDITNQHMISLFGEPRRYWRHNYQILGDGRLLLGYEDGVWLYNPLDGVKEQVVMGEELGSEFRVDLVPYDQDRFVYTYINETGHEELWSYSLQDRKSFQILPDTIEPGGQLSWNFNKKGKLLITATQPGSSASNTSTCANGYTTYKEYSAKYPYVGLAKKVKEKEECTSSF